MKQDFIVLMSFSCCFTFSGTNSENNKRGRFESNRSLWLVINGWTSQINEPKTTNKNNHLFTSPETIECWNIDVGGQLTVVSHLELSFTEFDLWPGPPLSVTPPLLLVAPPSAAEDLPGPPPVAHSGSDTSDTVGSAAPPRCQHMGSVLGAQQSQRTSEPAWKHLGQPADSACWVTTKAGVYHYEGTVMMEELCFITMKLQSSSCSPGSFWSRMLKTGSSEAALWISSRIWSMLGGSGRLGRTTRFLFLELIIVLRKRHVLHRKWRAGFQTTDIHQSKR